MLSECSSGSLTSVLVPVEPVLPRLPSVELFAGCGGLAIGLAGSGFDHDLLVEWNERACSTLDHNRRPECAAVPSASVLCADVQQVDWSPYRGAALVSGGPPCQPFSFGGKSAGAHDQRDMWPEAIRAVRDILPAAFVFENVKGLLRPAFADYVRWITRYLENPQLVREEEESHLQHLGRLEQARPDAIYSVSVNAVNAADYGAPQKRNRVIIVGVRKDVAALPDFPAPTHSQASLVWDKWISGSYWLRHGLPMPAPFAIPAYEARLVESLLKLDSRPSGLAWRTCRDAFLGLGDPSSSCPVPNHVYQAGARSYPGHTGSPIDEPAKALKAGVHGVPGGENMLALEDGSVRYFSIREAARLQGFPDSFEFPGSWSESMRQIGNAVPVQLATAVGKWLREVLD